VRHYPLPFPELEDDLLPPFPLLDDPLEPFDVEDEPLPFPELEDFELPFPLPELLELDVSDFFLELDLELDFFLDLEELDLDVSDFFFELFFLLDLFLLFELEPFPLPELDPFEPFDPPLPLPLLDPFEPFEPPFPLEELCDPPFPLPDSSRCKFLILRISSTGCCSVSKMRSPPSASTGPARKMPKIAMMPEMMASFVIPTNMVL